MIDTITDQLGQSIQNFVSAADVLPSCIEPAVQALLNTLMNNGRIFTVGFGHASSNLSNYFCAILQDQFLTERPALPAVSLNTESHINPSKILNSLGQQNDTVCIISNHLDFKNIEAIVQTAQSHNINTILLGPASCPFDIDYLIPALSENPAITHELQTSVIHCFARLIDQNLFGIQ